MNGLALIAVITVIIASVILGVGMHLDASAEAFAAKVKWMDAHCVRDGETTVSGIRVFKCDDGQRGTIAQINTPQ